MVKSVLLVTRRNITEAIRGASVLLDPLGDPSAVVGSFKGVVIYCPF